MIVCPACQTENRAEARVCVQCRRPITRIVGGLHAKEEAVGELHTVELPGASPASRSLQFDERAMRQSSRPPPRMNAGPGELTVERRSSSRPPPHLAEPSAMERALDLVAGPFDFLLRLTVRGPGADLTIHDETRNLRSRAPARLAFLLEAWGAIVCVLPAMLPTERPMYVPMVVVAVVMLIAMGGRMWVARSWNEGDDPNPIAMVLATFLSFAGLSAIVSVGAAALLGGIVETPTPGIRLNATGRWLVAIPLVLYGLLAVAAMARDRVRTARQRRGG